MAEEPQFGPHPGEGAVLETSTAANEMGAGSSSVWRIAWVIIFAGILLLAGGYAYYTTFDRFAGYDDEGYVMISVKEFNAGLPLYERVFSQYGPFLYVYNWLIHRAAGVPLTHNARRTITVVIWLLVSSACALCVYWLAKSRVLTALTFVLVMRHLTPMTWEPGHAGELCMSLMIAGVLMGLRVKSGRAGRFWWLILGAALAGLALTKINAGFYSFWAVVLAVIAVAPRTRLWTVAASLAGVFTVLLPAVVMRQHGMPGASVFSYCAIATGSLALACAGVFFQKGLPDNWSPRPRAFLAGFVGAGVLICAAVYLRGTSLSALAGGIVFRVLKLPDVTVEWFSPPFNWGMASLLASGLLFALGRFFPLRHRRLWLSVASAGVAVVLISCVMITDSPAAQFVSCTPVLWLLISPVLPEGRQVGGWTVGGRLRDSPGRFSRTLLGFTALLQTLYAYPTGGSGKYWATFLLIPAAVVILADCATVLSNLPDVPWKRRAVKAGHQVVVAALLCLAVADMGYAFFMNRQIYSNSVSLGLPGAERLHLEPQRVAILNWIVNNLRTQGDTFVTLPGSNSFYFWTEQDPPTGFNASYSHMLLTDDEQKAVVAEMERHPRACALIALENVQFWNAPLKGILADYLQREFVSVCEIGGYSFMVRKTRLDEPLSISLLSRPREFTSSGSFLPLPRGMFASTPMFSLVAWFRTSRQGVILGMQSPNYPFSVPEASVPLLYIGTDGRLRSTGRTRDTAPITSAAPLNDGQWHHIALVVEPGRRTLYVDGQAAGAVEGSGIESLAYAQLGNGWVADARDVPRWFPFSGTIDGVTLFDGLVLTQEQVQNLMAKSAAGR